MSSGISGRPPSNSVLLVGGLTVSWGISPFGVSGSVSEMMAKLREGIVQVFHHIVLLLGNGLPSVPVFWSLPGGIPGS